MKEVATKHENLHVENSRKGYTLRTWRRRNLLAQAERIAGGNTEDHGGDKGVRAEGQAKFLGADTGASWGAAVLHPYKDDRDF
jgi:hypothetical protein